MGDVTRSSTHRVSEHLAEQGESQGILRLYSISITTLEDILVAGGLRIKISPISEPSKLRPMLPIPQDYSSAGGIHQRLGLG